jgi:hypothetical protein
LFVLESRNAGGHDLQGLFGEDGDAVVGSLPTVDDVVPEIGDLLCREIRVWDLGFLQRDDIGLRHCEPFGELRQADPE